MFQIETKELFNNLEISSETTQSFNGLETVSDVQLSMEKKQEDVNILTVSFFHEFGEVWKSVDFLLRPLPIISTVHSQGFLCKNAAKKILTVVDMYPLNGIVKKESFKIKNFVRPIHRREIKQHAEILNEIDSKEKHTRCVVIDFKDVKKRYDCLEDISKAEKDFAAFFSGNGSDKKKVQAEIYNLFKNCKIDFFINEGSLKANLLKKTFSCAQSDFFQNNKKGSQILCQICEVIMNGFKQGYEVVVNECSFNPNDYISVVNSVVETKEDQDKEVKLPSIRLLTLYPNCYKETYSLESLYYQLITKIFRTSHEDKNNTTIIAIE